MPLWRSDDATASDEFGDAAVTVGDDGLVLVGEEVSPSDSDAPAIGCSANTLDSEATFRLSADVPPDEPVETCTVIGHQVPAAEQVTRLRMVADGVEVDTVDASEQPLPWFGPAEDVAAPPEEIAAPRPEAPSPFKPGSGEQEFDRLGRTILEVPVDIRPTEGALPENVAGMEFGKQPTIDETLPDDSPPDLFCSYTPWTICYRPLYFEDIALERYGYNVGYLQTGLSGVRFFSSVAALPYKMTRRPPRSCQCSNGFSRVGDCPLPCYGNRRFQWNAALVEAAAIAAVAYILP